MNELSRKTINDLSEEQNSPFARLIKSEYEFFIRNRDKRDIFFQNLYSKYDYLKSENDNASIAQTQEVEPIESKEASTSSFLDYRIQSVSLSGFRKIPPEERFFGLNFLRDSQKVDEISSLFLVGNNGTGKTSLFSAIEYAFTGKISDAELRNYDDTLLYIAHKGNAKGTHSIKINTINKEIECEDANYNTDIENANVFFCSEKDIYEIGRQRSISTRTGEEAASTDNPNRVQLDELTKYLLGNAGIRDLISLHEALKWREGKYSSSPINPLFIEAKEQIEEKIAELKKKIDKKTAEIEQKKEILLLVLSFFNITKKRESDIENQLRLKKNVGVDFVIGPEDRNEMGNPYIFEKYKGQLLHIKSAVDDNLRGFDELNINELNENEIDYFKNKYEKTLNIPLFNELISGLDEGKDTNLVNACIDWGIADFFVKRNLFFKSLFRAFLTIKRAHSEESATISDTYDEIENEISILKQRRKELIEEEKDSNSALAARVEQDRESFFSNALIEYNKALERKIKEISTNYFTQSIETIKNVMSNFSEENESINLNFSEDDGNLIFKIKLFDSTGMPEGISPQKYYNTFRYKLFCLALKIAQAFTYKKIANINFPLVLDDIFFTGDYYNRSIVKKFIATIYEAHNTIFHDNVDQQKLQLICFTHDEVILDAIANHVELFSQNDTKPIFGRLFDYEKMKDDESVTVKQNTFINLYDSFS